MPDKFIVAIGSSAGGLEPLKAYFDATPHDRATYVILTHLPVDHISKLQQILQRHSTLTIAEAEDNTAVEADRVYMIPTAMYMSIKSNSLFLHPRAMFASQPNRAIDFFLQSLAIDKGKLSIAIILSGAGTDGTKGIQYIKNAGGMVIVQTPASCQFSSMPNHALDTGHVDHILLPADMPPVVLRHVSSTLKAIDVLQALKQTGNNPN